MCPKWASPSVKPNFDPTPSRDFGPSLKFAPPPCINREFFIYEGGGGKLSGIRVSEKKYFLRKNLNQRIFLGSTTLLLSNYRNLFKNLAMRVSFIPLRSKPNGLPY